MTTQRRDGLIETSFARWTRNNPAIDSKEGLAVFDIDRIWHRYRSHEDKLGKRKLLHAMLIEEKSNMAELTLDQIETLWILSQAYQNRPQWKAKTPRGELVTFQWWGTYVLQYSGNEITIAESIYWGNFNQRLKKKVGLKILEQILLFNLNPITFCARDDRRHHRNHPELSFE